MMASPTNIVNNALTVNVFSSIGALRRSLESRQFRIYSCLNGFTLRALVNERAYDKLLISGQIGFVVDGLSAFWHLSAQKLACERICGRDLMAAALQQPHDSLVAVGGRQPHDLTVNDALARHLRRAITVLTPPMFKCDAELATYAGREALNIPADALVLIFIRSPLQDILAGELAARTENTVFINVGAVLDDILQERLGVIRLFSSLRLEWLYRLLTNPRRTLPKIIAMLRNKVNIANTHYDWHKI